MFLAAALSAANRGTLKLWRFTPDVAVGANERLTVEVSGCGEFWATLAV
jgi:hypothetical protein